MPNRYRRIKDFEKLKKISRVVFEDCLSNNKSHSRLKDLFSFYVVENGRNGGIDHRRLDVFYGNRPYDESTQADENGKLINVLDTAYGASLVYTRTDEGQVFCQLFPARTKKQGPIEDCIIIGLVKEPHKLIAKANLHAKYLVSYMAATCIDGKANFWQKITVSYLWTVKQNIIDGTIRDRKIWIYFKRFLIFILTVGCSGFVLLLVNHYLKD